MSYLEKQKRGNKYYYYLAHTIRLKNNKYKKVRLYLNSYEKELAQNEENNLVLDNIERFDTYLDEQFPELSTDFHIDIFFKDVDTLFLQSDLLQVEIVKKRYQKIKSNLDYYRTLRDSFLISHSYNSTKVEGNTLTKDDTILILSKGILSKTKELREANEILNISKAIDFIEEYDRELTVDFICQVHKVVTQNTLIESRNEGVLRPIGINVRMGNSDYKNVPGGNMIKKSLNDSIKEFNKLYKIDKLGAIVRFYASFIAIHPFIDGNGRTSRILLNWLMKKENLPYINYESEKHIEHIRGIDKAIKGNGFDDLAEFILTIVVENEFTRK